MRHTHQRDLGTWARRGVLGVVVLGSMYLLVSSLVQGKPAPEPVTQVKIEHVRSGDRVKLDSGEKLAYAGIRTPVEGEPLFAESTRRNVELVEGKSVRLRYDEERADHKQRDLAYVFNGADFINERLVREGLAYVRLTNGSGRYAERLLAAMAEARKAKRGLWAQATPAAEREYPADPKYGNFHRASCAEAAKMNPQRRLVFASRDDALKKGFAPCVQCRP